MKRKSIARFLLVLLSMPFALVVACVLVLPFFLPLFLIKGFHPLSLWIYVVLLILLAGFLFHYTRKKYLSGRKTSRKAFMAGVGLVILAGIFVHTVFNLSSSWVLKQSVKRAQVAGISLKLEDIIPPEIPDERNAAVVWSRVFKLYDRLYGEHRELLERSINYMVKNHLKECLGNKKSL